METSQQIQHRLHLIYFLQHTWISLCGLFNNSALNNIENYSITRAATMNRLVVNY